MIIYRNSTLFYIPVSLPIHQAQEVPMKYSISLTGAGTRGKNHVCITFSGYCIMMHVPIGYESQLCHNPRYSQDETFYDHPGEEALVLQALIRLTYNMSFILPNILLASVNPSRIKA